MISFKDLLLRPVEIVDLFQTNKTSIYSWEKEGLLKTKIENGTKYFTKESIGFLSQKKNIPRPNNKVQVFSNIKGGVGKSTISAQYIMLASLLGLKCLAIDLDAQSHLTYQLGHDSGEDALSIFDVIIEKKSIEDCIVKISENIDLLPSNLKLSAIEMSLINMRKREFKIAEALQEIKGNYDLIVADTNPSITMLNLNMYVASDLINIISATDFLSYSGLKLMLDQVVDLKQDFSLKSDILIIPNLYDHRNGICQRSLGAIKDHYNDFVSKTIIRENTSLRDCTQLKNSIFFVNRRSNGKEDLIDLTMELLNK